MKKLKITPILIVFGMVEIILLYYTFLFLFIDKRTGIEIGGIIAFIFFILNSIFLLVEQIIANNTLKLKSLYLFETIFIVVIASYMLIKRLYF